MTKKHPQDLHLEQMLRLVEQTEDKSTRTRLLSQLFCMATGIRFAG